MPRRTAWKQLPEHRFYPWPDKVYVEIKRKLSERRTTIAEMLAIDIDDNEAWARPARKSKRNLPQSGDCAKATGREGSDFEFVDSINFVIEELALALVMFDAALADVNALASEPEARRILMLIAKRLHIFESEIEVLDLGVRELLAIYYPGGRDRFAPDRVKSSDVRTAANTALAILPKPSRGRPKGSRHHAALALAKDLVAIYENHSDTKASRSVIVSTSLNVAIPDTRESGKFLRFFEFIIGALPPETQEKVTRVGGGNAALVRSALREIRSA